MTFGVYSENTAREIYRRVMQVPDTTGNNPAGNIPPGSVYYCITNEALLPATDPFTGYTTCDCKVLRYVDPPVTATPYDMEEADGPIATIKVVNRSAFTSLPIGTLLIVIKIGVEFAIIWADCSNPASSSGFPSITSSTGVSGSSSSSEAPPPP